MPEDILAGYNSLEHIRPGAHQADKGTDAAIHPACERFKVPGLHYGGSSKALACQGVVLRQKVNNTLCLILINNGGNHICLQQPGFCLFKAGPVIVALCQAHGVEAHKLFRAGECYIKLVLEDGIVLLVNRATIEIGLESFLFIDSIHIHALAVTIGVSLGAVIGHRVFQTCIILHVICNGGKLSGGIAPAALRHSQRGKGIVISSISKNGSAPYLRDGINYRVEPGFENTVSHADKLVYIVNGCRVRLSGHLGNNTI